MNRGDFLRKIHTVLAEGGVVLTATRRLARHLQRGYAEERTCGGVAAWLTPEVLGAEAWLERQLVRLGTDWRLLPDHTVRRLWEEVIEAEALQQGLDLLQVPATARMAMAAHDLLVDHATTLEGWPLNDDQRVFAVWRSRVVERLRADGWIDPATLADLVAAELEAGRLPIPAQLTLAGFDLLPPRLERLGKALERSGCRVTILPPPQLPAGKAGRLPCRDARDEVRQAARWARGLLDAGGCRIGVVVPEMTAYRPLIERQFLEEIDPAALPAFSDHEVRFGLSLGAPLGTVGPAAAALDVLRLPFRPGLEDLGRLLRSPYLGGARSEEAGRALFDRHLRSLRQPGFILPVLRRQLGHPGFRRAVPQGLPIFSATLATFQDHLQSDRPRPAATWARDFASLLEAVGWPGDRPLDSRDFQAVQAVQEKLLPRLGSLSAVSGALHRAEALRLLGVLAGEIEFQVETPDPGIQVCGVLEAGGLDFDHLWILGLHETAWPQPTRPNPFLPLALQRERGMPHADPGREAEFARGVLGRLVAAAPRVIASHPLQEGDCRLGPSPLIAGWPGIEPQLAPSRAPLVAIRDQAPPAGLERLADHRGPALAAGEPAGGGTSILRDQALCPFRAFARHRLAVRELECAASPGLDPALRGTLAHAVLEAFWSRVENHARLAALTMDQRLAQVREVVEGVLDGALADFPVAAAEALVANEQVRLERLLEEWLTAVELNRPSPAAVVRTETAFRLNFGGLDVRTKIDRIDTLDDGRYLIIDYKTGNLVLDDLLTAPPLEPQLPMYAVGAAGEALAGVGIGELKAGKCALKGVAREEGLLASVDSFAGSRLARKHGLGSWNELLERWRGSLEGLGRDFMGGEAAVRPVSEKKACRRCDLHGFCRIADRAQRDDEEEPA